MAAVRLLHISDIHLPAPAGALRFREWACVKRVLGGLNYGVRRRRAFREAPRRVGELAAFARDQQVDCILFTGDISSLGAEGELAAARRVVQPLIEAAPTFLCLSGNHDVYVERDSWRRAFGDVSPHTGDEEAWPRKAVLGDGLTVWLLDSARPLRSPFLSNGRIARRVLGRLSDRLDRGDGYRLVALHHGPWRAGGRPDGYRHGLADRAALERVLEERPRLAVLHGHLHRGFRLEGPGRPTVFCAGSATQEGLAGAWLFSLEPDRRAAFRVEYGTEGYRLASPPRSF